MAQWLSTDLLHGARRQQAADGRALPCFLRAGRGLRLRVRQRWRGQASDGHPPHGGGSRLLHRPLRGKLADRAPERQGEEPEEREGGDPAREWGTRRRAPDQGRRCPRHWQRRRCRRRGGAAEVRHARPRPRAEGGRGAQGLRRHDGDAGLRQVQQRGDGREAVRPDAAGRGRPRRALALQSTVSKFFKLVAESLDDKRMRDEGLKFLEVIRAHRVSPSTLAQNRLIVAWRSKPPDDVLAYFVKMKDAGVMLSSTAYRCIMAANERTNPEFTLKLYDEMKELGIKLDRVAYNAVLCACSQNGMLDQARELFMQMTSTGLVPNGKTFGIMIKVYYSSNRPKEAVAIFDTMREQHLEPDRFAYHHVINACIKLQRIEYAVELYKDMLQAKLPPCDNTHIYLSAACKKHGWTTTADQVMKDLECVKEAHKARASPTAPGARASGGSE
ncbi:unnamed protein product [Prorocentrum cordatum]|uniref:Pentacotripeptide-repeat region of PRORP domain-containing protein n=1 Tax=Prorocentrum cordatum TaxID=2364126 RepID=A0ABN9X217_9DINO|nr:unnamed protein product [Polarella glacialis]